MRSSLQSLYTSGTRNLAEIRALKLNGHRFWHWIHLFLLTATTAGSQPIFYTELGIAGATAEDLIVLPDGDLISAGHRNGQLQLVRWSAQGDTLWVVDDPMPVPASAEERRLEIRLLTTGEVLVTTLSGSSLYDQQGAWLNALDLRGMHVLELGVDSLLACTSDSLFLMDRSGDSIWERAIVRPGLSEQWYTKVSSGPSGFFTLTSQVAGEFQAPGGTLQLGRYTRTGDLLDTLTVASSALSGGLAGTWDLSRTADGGGVGTAGLFYTFRIIRFNAEGDTLWTRSFSPFDPPGEGLQPFWPTGEILELMNGHLLVSGHASDNAGSSSPALAELDHEGNLICLERYGTLPGGAAAYRSAMAQGMDGVIYLLSGISNPFSAMSAGLRAFNDLCVVTSVDGAASTSTCSTPVVWTSSGQTIVGRRSCESSVRYQVFGSSGLLIAEGATQGGTLRIDLGSSISGMVVVKLEEVTTGDIEVFKLILP
ncbi:MAG: hypothetical protein H6590_03345 [Flavobacteriales bacterium]|nr:hypothetical protein [Flavobacteriales bacterium]MCB9178443.1 hypothetical protein [Flavobacteriales bacterium]